MRVPVIPREALSHLLVCVCPADSAVHVVHVVTSVFDGSELVQTHMLARHPAAVLALGRPPGGVTLMPKIRALSCGRSGILPRAQPCMDSTRHRQQR